MTACCAATAAFLTIALLVHAAWSCHLDDTIERAVLRARSKRIASEIAAGHTKKDFHKCRQATLRITPEMMRVCKPQ